MSAIPVVRSVTAMWTSSARVGRPAHWQFSKTWMQLASRACEPSAQRVTPHHRTRRYLSTPTPASSSSSSSNNNTESPFRLTSHKSSTVSSDHGASSSFSSSTPSPSSPNQRPEDRDLSPKDEYYSPYKPKRQWPPDMSKLSPKHQFRLERKYRRRAALKYARPKWTKATILVQWGVIGFVVIYAVLFMEWDTKNGKNPFEGFRKQVFASVNSIFSTPAPPRPNYPANRGEERERDGK